MVHRAIRYAVSVACLLVSVGPGSAPALAHHAVAHDLLVSKAPWVVVDLLDSTTARAYFSLHNRSRHEHRLVRAASPVATTTTLNASPRANSTESHNALTTISLPARSNTEFTPAGAYIKLNGVHPGLEPGDRLQLNLYFQDESVLRLEAAVRTPTGFP